jgi:hypothetical protein
VDEIFTEESSGSNKTSRKRGKKAKSKNENKSHLHRCNAQFHLVNI